MEAKINIAEILKDKPQGTKLYSPIFGNLRYEDLVPDFGEFTVVTSDNTSAKHSFRSDGRYNRHGEPLMLLPSKEMRDWCKFSWKKGDVLVSNDGKIEVIFEKFRSDTYQSFIGKHHLDSIDEHIHYQGEGEYCTFNFNIETQDATQTYINTIEARLGGKLNRETLEIEKAQSFKDGDIVTIMPHIGEKLIYLFKAEDDEKYYGHAFLDGNIAIINEDSYCLKDFCTARPSTEEEKMMLFEALAKKGKAWDSEKKEIVDLKPKVELKPFDKVLVRDSKSDYWRANLFGYIDRDGYYRCVYANWIFCIPYEGNESLLGTTNDVEG